ncbi:MAG TPA: class I fructose-bisphosphate aldolase [Vicinamibacterales bacterium]|nr:class I fructose-bisphosphate aldolase [Vicinamibacterales bacterium]
MPAAVPGTAFLSGGQDHLAATVHLNAINPIDARPWTASFSCGRALQDEALNPWQGSADRLAQGQQAFHHRATCGSAAARAATRHRWSGKAVVA